MALVRAAQQRHHVGDVVAGAHGAADPARAGKGVVRDDLTGTKKRVGVGAAQRNVNNPVAVQMADLASVYVKLRSAEAVGMNVHSRPNRQDLLDLL